MQFNFVETKEQARARMERIKQIQGAALSRPVAEMTDQELMAKVSGAPLTVAEDVLISYEGNLARMAGSTAKQMKKIAGIGKVRSEKITAAFELGKRLARFHAERDKIQSPADVADLMMSKMRYLQLSNLISENIIAFLAENVKINIRRNYLTLFLFSDIL